MPVEQKKVDYTFEKYALYFCGGGGDRDTILRQVYIAAEENGVSCNFVVLDHEQHGEIPGIQKISVPMPYP